MSAPELYIPPKPLSLWSVVALARVLWKGDGNLLELLPAAAYHFDVGNLGYSRRSTVLFNEPQAVREIMRDAEGVFPKSDLMVSALEHLIGDSIFVTDGERWKRQRAMIDPAFSHMRISHAFGAMKAAVDDHLLTLEEKAASGEAFSLDLAMSHLTADIICRTVFSTPLQTGVAVDVFEDFTLFERSAVQVDVLRLTSSPPGATSRSRRRYWQPASGFADIWAPWLIRTLITPRRLMTSPVASLPRATRRPVNRSPARSSLISWVSFFWLATRPPRVR